MRIKSAVIRTDFVGVVYIYIYIFFFFFFFMKLLVVTIRCEYIQMVEDRFRCQQPSCPIHEYRYRFCGCYGWPVRIYPQWVRKCIRRVRYSHWSDATIFIQEPLLQTHMKFRSKAVRCKMIMTPRALHRKTRNYSLHKRCNVFCKNAL